jgi:hypothetical protein
MCPVDKFRDIIERDDEPNTYINANALEHSGRVIIDSVDARAVLADKQTNAQQETFDQLPRHEECADRGHEATTSLQSVRLQRQRDVFKFFTDIIGVG